MKENDNYADSLEENAFSNLMANKSRSKEKQKSNLQEMEISIFGLKTKFNSALEKLSQSDTRQMAMKQLTKLIDDFRNQETLRIYLSILKGIKRNAVNNGTKQHQILVIAYICEKYKENLIDPIDKPPSLMKTAFRVVELIHKYFPQNSMTVQQACARALIDLYSYCIKKESVQNRISLIFLPLASIMTTGMDRMSQSTASVCITQLVQYWYNNKQYEILKRVQSELLFVFFKINPEFYELLSAITICLQLSGMDFFENKFTQFITKIQSFLNDSSYQSIRNTSNQFNSYMAKVETCKMFEKIAMMITDHPEYLEQIKPMEIMAELEKSARNRVIQVQRASQKALKAWRVLLKIEETGNGDQAVNERIAPYKLASLDEMRKKFKRQRSFSKEESEQKTRKFEKIEEELKFMKQDLSQLVKGKGWGPQNRGHHFIKKGTGIGGGHVGKLQISPGSKNRKTYQNHLKELKKFVQNQRINKKHNKLNIQSQQNNINKSQMEYENMKINDDRIIIKSPITKEIDRNQDPFYKQNEIAKNLKNLEIDKNEDQQFLEIKDQKGQQQFLPLNKNYNKIEKQIQQNDKNIQISQQNIQLHPNNEISYSQKKDSRILQFLKKPDIEIKSKQQFLSNQEIEDIMKNTSLDNISSYLGDVLNEEDLLNRSKLQLMDSKIIQQGDDHIKIRELKHIQQQNKNSNLKNQEQEKPKIKLDTDSLSLSNSKNKIYKQQMEESLRLELSKYQEQRKLLNSSATKNEQIKHQQSQNTKFQIGKNLLEVPVVNSNNKNKESDRFSNLKPTNTNPDEQEIQEEVISMYQQSKQPNYSSTNREKKPLGFTKKQIKQIQFYELNRGNNFQNLIKNPPKQRHQKQQKLISQRNKIKDVVKQQQSKNITQSQQDELLIGWRQTLEFIQQEDFDMAFQKVFQMDDSIYLVRLLLLTGGNLDRLTPSTIKQLWKRFTQVYQSRFFEILMLANFQQALGLGILNKTLNLNQSNYLLTILFEMSGYHTGKLSYKSAVLYNQIEKKLKE